MKFQTVVLFIIPCVMFMSGEACRSKALKSTERIDQYVGFVEIPSSVEHGRLHQNSLNWANYTTNNIFF